MHGTTIHYKGYTLKSKIEHAWAQFFDARRFDWEYEPVKFRGAAVGVYTPDFRLNAHHLYIETKPYTGFRKLNKFYLCSENLLVCFGTPQKCFVWYKPAGAVGANAGHWNDFESAFTYVVARPSWLERPTNA